MNCTLKDPGCYHQMIKYLAEINNVSQYAVDWVFNIRDLYHHPDAKKAKHRGLKYKSYDIIVVDENQCQHPFIINSQRFDYKNEIKYKMFLCKRLMKLSEFALKPIKISKYEDSLGGGWKQNVDLYQVDDKFFAMVDCTC